MNATSSTKNDTTKQARRYTKVIANKAEVLEDLREGARRDVERALLILQTEIATAEAEAPGTCLENLKPLNTIARRLRSAWNLPHCIQLEIGAMARELGAEEAAVRQ
jgi:hypothetical protein